MWNGVVLELSGGKELGPLVWVIYAEDPDVSFDFLIGSFSLSVSLGVIGSREADIVFKDSSEFSGEGRCELWATIRDEGIMKSKVFEYVVKKELGNSVRINGLRARS